MKRAIVLTAWLTLLGVASVYGVEFTTYYDEAAFLEAVDSSSLVTIGFDDVEGVFPGDKWQSLGVVFGSDERLVTGGWWPVSPPNTFAPGGGGVDGNILSDDFWADFSNPVAAVGFWVHQNIHNDATDTLTLYVASGEGVYSAILPYSTDTGVLSRVFVGIVASEPVIRRAFCETGDSFRDNVEYDNFHFALLPAPTNTPPLADAGPDQTVECTGALTAVALDGTSSSDPDGDPLMFEWSAPEGVVLDDPFSATPTGLFPTGPSLVTLTVTDGKGGMATADVLITVQDTMPPVIVCTTDIGVIWPPDHRMVNVPIRVQASDACTSPESLLILCRVTSSEPDDASGDGSLTGDVNGLDGFSRPVAVQLAYDPATLCYVGEIALRAERDGSDAGRTYSVVSEVFDTEGNQNTAGCVVIVPHDRRRQK